MTVQPIVFVVLRRMSAVVSDHKAQLAGNMSHGNRRNPNPFLGLLIVNKGQIIVQIRYILYTCLDSACADGRHIRVSINIAVRRKWVQFQFLGELLLEEIDVQYIHVGVAFRSCDE